MTSTSNPKAGTSRRDFLRTVAAAALAGCAPVGTPPLPPGELLGMSHALGHRLRDGSFPAPAEFRRTAVVIVGAGISGLAAAWKLAKAGVDDFLVLEMEGEPGGNSRAGQSSLVAYPWGAHYLPLPTRESTAVRELLAELAVLQGDPAAGKPVYEERYLCATPQERIYRNGLWEEGLLPHRGIDAGERAHQRRFHERMEELKEARGQDGRRAFAIPMELSSRDPEWLALDRVSFSDWLNANGFTAPSLHWLANYATRDDYGTAHDQTSAWAGLHYFACRTGEAANAASDAVLTARWQRLAGARPRPACRGAHPDRCAGLARRGGEVVCCGRRAARGKNHAHRSAASDLGRPHRPAAARLDGHAGRTEGCRAGR